MAPIPCVLLLSLLIVASPLPGSCEDSFLIQCFDLALTANGTAAFRAGLLRLLRALPSAAAPTGFASLRSPTGAAFVRGLCFGESTAPSECRRCLSVAARNVASGCGATTRRTGVWSDRCFVAYADSDASTPRENAFRSRLLLRGYNGLLLAVIFGGIAAALALVLVYALCAALLAKQDKTSSEEKMDDAAAAGPGAVLK